MDFSQIWQDYKELVLVIATALATLVATLLGQKILPGLWKSLARLWGKFVSWLGKGFSAKNFERRYLECLCEEHRFLRVRGIHTRSPVSVKLEEVYVSLALNRPPRDEKGRQLGVDTVFKQELADARGPGPVSLLEMRAEKPERLSIGQVLKNCPRRLVILGVVNSGIKSPQNRGIKSPLFRE